MSSTGPERGAGFTAVMAAIAGRLPMRLNRVVSGRLLGFAVISSITFTLDLALLTAFHGGLRWPLPAAITAAYAVASGLGYVLNRALNFRSHGAVGPQLTVYAAVVTVNYVALILGVSTGLAALGADYRLARLAAAASECVYMYSAMRWLVFRDAGPGRISGRGKGGRPGEGGRPGRGGAAAGPDAALTARPHEDDAAPQCRS
jgi:putative flippase GtrA